MRGMKNSLCLMVLGLSAAGLVRGEDPFSRRVSAEEFRTAGLVKLSSEELAQLDALFQKYGVPPGSSRQPEPRAVAVQPPAPPAVPVDKSPGDSGVMAKARRIFSLPAAKPNPATIESQIDGWFEGWTRDTVWLLKDGTRWRVENNERPFKTRPAKDRKVKIYPAAINGHWLELPEFDQKLRVRQLP